MPRSMRGSTNLRGQHRARLNHIMSIKSITSLFLAVCALSVPMANGDTPDYIEITGNTKVSELPEPISTQEYRLMNGSTLLVDEPGYESTTAFRCYGDNITSTIVFTASGSNEASQALTTLTASSVWVGYQGKTEDNNTHIQITLDAAGAKAIRALATEDSTYVQDIVMVPNPNYGRVYECITTGHWCSFVLTDTLGWTVIVPGVQDESYISSMQNGEIALIGYDKYYHLGATASSEPAAGEHYDYVSYSRLAIVAKGTPEPATATLSLLALAALCARRRRVA